MHSALEAVFAGFRKGLGGCPCFPYSRILAIIALLGFSTACSTTKQSAKSSEEKAPKAEVTPSIVVMYGVRRPVQPAPEPKKVDVQTPSSAEPATQPEGGATTK
mgnify:CR=1 FL=1